jgi:glucose-1-phosphate thymidylyltransferase
VFAYAVNDPERYGVVEFDHRRRAVSIDEKPAHPKSQYAITGLYFFDNDVIRIAASLEASGRGELEISDVNKIYLKNGKLDVEVLGRGFAWLDTGTHSSLLEAATYVQILEQRQGMRIACPEEVALRRGYITRQAFLDLAQRSAQSSYGQYLFSVHDSHSENGDPAVK